MDIEYLKRKRQKSVQQQNAVLKHKISCCAENWLNGEKLPKPIEKYLNEKGINRDNALLIEYHGGPAQYQMSYSGILITNDEDFIGFEFDLNVRETNIEYVENFGKVSIETSCHLHGVGKSFGCLSKEVLHEIRS
ncbi:hypothetical protein NBRC116583_07910 [Arenicella sp. 4NH20-0111]|uniref:hypothetical protein n=1 Tax=Arenicella sp. 4NH20-0111 TaxID=3127648 RepID=UPI00310B9E78